MSDRERPDEPLPGADELELAGGVSRRGFFGLMGASAALAGVSLSGCLRKPREPIVPFAQRPEDLIPGKPRVYATAACVGGGVLGLLVESQDGRPTKIEGNPAHSMSLGAASAWAQAEVLNLYDPDRCRRPLRGGKESSWGVFGDFAGSHFGALRRSKGRGLALLIEHVPSPTLHRLLGDLRAQLPEARIYLHDVTCPRNSRAGAALVGTPRAQQLYGLDRTDVVLVLDSDLLGTEGDVVRNQRLLAARRRIISPMGTLNRLYVVEPSLTTTGAAADNRLALRSSEVGELLEALAVQLLAGEPQLSSAEERKPPKARQALAAFKAREAPKVQALRRAMRGDAAAHYGKWIPVLAAELRRNAGRSLIVVGERQPPLVHALALLLNESLDNIGYTLSLVEDTLAAPAETIDELAAAIRAREVRTLVVLGGNPAYDTPADLGFDRLLAQVPERIHLSSHVDETSRLCTWQLPRSHFLEAWGDLRATDGTCSIVQPLIAPLFDSASELELLARLLGSRASGYDLVRATWSARSTPASLPTTSASAAAVASGELERQWRRWLHEGVVIDSAPLPIKPKLEWEAVVRAWPRRPTAQASSPESLELVFNRDPSVLDGRYANNPWLQELPDPVTKLTWDNAACLSPRTAETLGVVSSELVEISCRGRTLRAAALVVPGTVDNNVMLALGYGRRAAGRVGTGVGFDAHRLRGASSAGFERGAQLKRSGGRHAQAITQEHASMEGRPIVREGTIAQFHADPGFAAKMVGGPPLRSLWTEDERAGQQWGMSIDLNTCIGCSACVVACQAENNIPTVGKQRIIERRMMHWMRVDRYFVGPREAPLVAFQPVACQHCENAPCEEVCPVAATAHSPEGLNDMAYNRCIGTRYCANNCPYKVRRFNFFQYNKGLDPLARMQKNPDVTMRFRGVMEKCTYCVQRIQEAKIKVHREQRDAVPDGAIVPACAQTCPSQAIVFGDINDPESAVSKRKQHPGDYALLGQLNVKPRTTYKVKLRNPNPELA
jgi:Fe-S-cluster-containing dehydrogenase component/anaerobic selenocysteine-containing dehydrogenase